MPSGLQRLCLKAMAFVKREVAGFGLGIEGNLSRLASETFNCCIGEGSICHVHITLESRNTGIQESTPSVKT